MCPGPSKCEYSRTFLCQNCAETIESEEDQPTCERCGSDDVRAQRCPQCGLTKLDEVMGTWAGRLIVRALDMLFAGRMQVKVNEPNLQEFRAMQIIEDERAKAEKDRGERDRNREQSER